MKERSADDGIIDAQVTGQNPSGSPLLDVDISKLPLEGRAFNPDPIVVLQFASAR